MAKEDKPINFGKNEEKKKEVDELEEDPEFDKWGRETIQYLLHQVIENQEKQEKSDQLTVNEIKPLQTFDDEEVADMLEEHTPLDYVSTRPGGGGALRYIEGNMVIQIANSIFGYSGWKTKVKNQNIVVDEYNKDKKNYLIGSTALVKVKLVNGGSHEDTGFGKGIDKNKAIAAERAFKSAVTDGIKRALRQFGNLFGNSLYNTDYLLANKNNFDHKKPRYSITRKSLREDIYLERKNEIEKKPKHDKKEIKNKVETKPLKKEITVKNEREKKEEEKKEMEEEEKEHDSIDDILNGL